MSGPDLHEIHPKPKPGYVDHWLAKPDDSLLYDKRAPDRVWHWNLNLIADRIEELENAGELPNRMSDGERWFLSFDIELLAWRWLMRRRGELGSSGERQAARPGVQEVAPS